MSENITAAIALNGEMVTNQPLIKAMRVVKKETLKLISDWISRTHDHVMVMENFIPPFLDAVLLDYQRTAVPSAREPEVLSAIATIVNKLEMHITPEVYSCTIPNFYLHLLVLFFSRFRKYLTPFLNAH